LISLVLTSWIMASMPGSAPGSAELEEISRSVLNSAGRVKTLLYDLEMSSRAADGSEQVDRCLMALSADRCFVDFVHFANIYTDPWLDPDRARSWSDQGGTTTLRLFERNAYRAGPESAAEQRASPYSQAIGWQPPAGPSGAARGKVRNFYLDEVFAPAHLAELRVNPSHSVVEGLDCVEVVANDGSDRLWLCPERGYALVRRTFRHGPGDGLTVEYLNSDFLMVADALWLPRSCKGEFRDSGGGKFHHSFSLRVKTLGINAEVDANIFRPELPPGTHIYDEEDRLIGSLPGGEDLLDLWLLVSLKLFPPKGRAVRMGGDEMRWAFVWGAIPMILGLAAAGSRMERLSSHWRRDAGAPGGL